MNNPDLNPYAAPLTNLVPQVVSDVEVWRDGLLLLAHKDASLPDRCVKCNNPAEGVRLNRRLFWHPWPIYLIALINLIVYALVALMVRKEARIQIGLCPRHLKRRWIAIAIGWLVPLGSLAAIIYVCSTKVPDAVLISVVIVGVPLMLGAALTGVFLARTVWPKKIDDNFVWLKGVCPEFLAEIPEVTPIVLWRPAGSSQ